MNIFWSDTIPNTKSRINWNGYHHSHITVYKILHYELCWFKCLHSDPDLRTNYARLFTTAYFILSPNVDGEGHGSCIHVWHLKPFELYSFNVVSYLKHFVTKYVSWYFDAFQRLNINLIKYYLIPQKTTLNDAPVCSRVLFDCDLYLNRNLSYKLHHLI